MQEYWFNVYYGSKGADFDYKCDAEKAHKMIGADYRVHVKCGQKSSRSFYPMVWVEGVGAVAKSVRIRLPKDYLDRQRSQRVKMDGRRWMDL